MEGNKHTDNNLQQLRDRFEMNPPENAWNLLDADLDRKQANMYKSSSNRFKLLSVLLALLLIPFIVFYTFYSYPALSGNNKNFTTKDNYGNVNADLALKNTKLSTRNNSDSGNKNSKRTATLKIEKRTTPNEEISLNNNSSKELYTKSNPEIKERNTTKRDNTRNENRSYSITINKDKTLIYNKPTLPNISTNQRINKEVVALEKGNYVHTKNKEFTDNNKGNKIHTLKSEIENTNNSLTVFKPKQSRLTQNKKASAEKEVISGLIDNNLQNEDSDAKQQMLEKEFNTVNKNPTKADSTTNGRNESILKQNNDITRTIALPDTKNVSAKVEPKNEAKLTKTKNKRMPFSIGFYYTPNYFTGFRMVRNTAVRSYGYNPNDYNQSEKTNYSFATGLKVRYDVNKHLGISIGGTYSTLAYSMALSTIYVRYGTNRQLHFQYPTPCGNIEIPNTSNTTLHYGDSLKTNTTCRQVIKLISIPLTVRYHFNKSRFKLYAEGGISANFVLQEKANLTIGNTESTIINNISGLQNMNYGYLVSGGAEYALFHHINVFIEPSFQGTLTSLTQKTAYYCYPFTFNLNTGLSLHL